MNTCVSVWVCVSKQLNGKQADFIMDKADDSVARHSVVSDVDY